MFTNTAEKIMKLQWRRKALLSISRLGEGVKYCIAVQETLRREIVVEADSLEDALDHVEKEYDKENIVLTADDMCTEPDIFEPDWYSEEELKEVEADYDIRNSSGRISEGWRRHIQHRFQRWG